MSIVSKPDLGWDFAVEDKQSRLILVVEVKRKKNVSPQWASKLRRNILSHHVGQQAPYFLIVFLDKFYLWSDSHKKNGYHEPNYIVDAIPILKPYFRAIDIVEPKRISPASLELIIGTWLNEIIYSQELSKTSDNANQWLIKSGLYRAIHHGTLQHEGIR